MSAPAAGSMSAPIAGSLSPPAAGSASSEKPCASGTSCDDRCVQLDSDPAHCGSCGNACKGNRVCFSGTCTKPKDLPDDATTLDVDELERLLDVFGVSLEEFAKAMDVDVDELEDTEIGVSDLGRVGITIAALALLGFTADALELIGIDVDR